MLSVADGAYPILGGILVGLSWIAPWYLQVLALPIGLVVLTTFKDWVPLPQARPHGWSGVAVALDPLEGTLSLHYVAFLRFFVKFGLLSYLPLLLVVSRGMTAAQPA